MANGNVPLYVNNTGAGDGAQTSTGSGKHLLYENEVLENLLENKVITALDMNQFLTTDTSLSENAGMKKVINKYTATGDAETLAMGAGNSEEISVSFEPVEYVVGTDQAKFVYYDEQEMNDPMVVEAGLDKMAKIFVDKATKDAVGEWDKASLIKYGCTWTFDDVADAIALYPYENEDGLFMLISPELQAAFRKNLKDNLSYVEAFVRTGYIGSVCGVPVYVSKALDPDARLVSEPTAILADRKAVTNFIKKGFEVEQERDADHRKNTVIGRKVGIVALSDETRVVKMVASDEP